MKKFTIGFLLCVVANVMSAQIPEWYQAEMTRQVGTWVADNNDYISENETDDAYAITWEYGVGKTSLLGRLYGMKDGKRTYEYWQFFQFYDSEKEKVRFIQISGTGVRGEGFIERVDATKAKLQQTFVTPDGRSYEEGHRTKFFPDHEVSTSYEIKGEKWVQKRSYSWYKE